MCGPLPFFCMALENDENNHRLIRLIFHHHFECDLIILIILCLSATYLSFVLRLL